MNWNHIISVSQLDTIDEESRNQPVLILKHSTRCSISAAVLGRLERQWNDTAIKPYHLDLLQHREISDAIANRYGIEHESPQAILIRDGKVVYSKSHMEISLNDLTAAVK